MDPDLFDALPEPTVRLSGQLKIEGQNARSIAWSGERTGEPCHLAQFGRDTPCEGCQAREVLAGGSERRWFMTVEDPAGGRPSYFEVTVVPVKDGEGQVTGLLEILRDATVSLGLEQHLIRNSGQLEQEVADRAAEVERLGEEARSLATLVNAMRGEQARQLHTEKMASLGRLAAGLAHEIHTPLGALVSNIDLLRRGLGRIDRALADDDEDEQARQIALCRRLLDMQAEASKRIHSIIRSLREFSHLDQAELEAYDLRIGLDSALALLQHLTRGRIEVERDYGRVPKVLCRPDAINQVFMNVLQNAVQFIEGRGTIRVALRSEDGDHVAVEIRDSGCGISPEYLGRVFEPGFTTRSRGVGTGLGLAIVYSTVLEHGGRVDIESEPGEWTLVRVVLPVRGKS